MTLILGKLTEALAKELKGDDYGMKSFFLLF